MCPLHITTHTFAGSHHYPDLHHFAWSPHRIITSSHHHHFTTSAHHIITTVVFCKCRWTLCSGTTASRRLLLASLPKIFGLFCHWERWRTRCFVTFSWGTRALVGGEEYCGLDYAGLQRVRIQKFEIRGQCKWGVKVTTVRSCNSRAIAFTVSTASRVGTTANYCTASTASRWLLLVCVCACALWVLGVSLSLRLCEMLHQDAIRDSCTWLNQMSNDSSRVFFTEPRGAMCLGSKALNSHGQTSLPSCRKFPIRVSCAGVTVLYLYSDRLKTCITAVVKFMQRHAWFKSPVVLPVMFAPLPG